MPRQLTKALEAGQPPPTILMEDLPKLQRESAARRLKAEPKQNILSIECTDGTQRIGIIRADERIKGEIPEGGEAKRLAELDRMDGFLGFLLEGSDKQPMNAAGQKVNLEQKRAVLEQAFQQLAQDYALKDVVKLTGESPRQYDNQAQRSLADLRCDLELMNELLARQPGETETFKDVIRQLREEVEQAREAAQTALEAIQAKDPREALEKIADISERESVGEALKAIDSLDQLEKEQIGEELSEIDLMKFADVIAKRLPTDQNLVFRMMSHEEFRKVLLNKTIGGETVPGQVRPSETWWGVELTDSLSQRRGNIKMDGKGVFWGGNRGILIAIRREEVEPHVAHRRLDFNDREEAWITNNPINALAIEAIFEVDVNPSDFVKVWELKPKHEPHQE